MSGRWWWFNDRLSNQPIYYALTRNGLIFASGVRALLADTALPCQTDRLGIAQFLTFDHLLDDRTFLEDVKLLPQASLLTFQQSVGDEGQMSIRRYWDELSKIYDKHLPLRDTPMGNLVTDSYRALTCSEVAISALGLISEKFAEGPILGADLFRTLSYGYDEATGFGFRMATFDIAGYELVRGMEIGLSQLEIGDDFFLQYSGLRFSYDPLGPIGERVDLASIRVNGKK